MQSFTVGHTMEHPANTQQVCTLPGPADSPAGQDSLLWLRQQLAIQSTELRRLTLELQTAEQRERTRIAERLHQDLQQTLAAVRLKLFLLERQVHDPLHRQTVSQACAMLDEAILATRDLASDLASPALADGLPAALQCLAQKMLRDHQLLVHLEIAPDAEVPDLPRRELLLHCLRELLFNVSKHASVAEAHLQLCRTAANSIEATVRDAGRPRSQTSLTPGFGLRNIQSRLGHLGGTLSLHSGPAGTTARITLPL